MTTLSCRSSPAPMADQEDFSRRWASICRSERHGCGSGTTMMALPVDCPCKRCFLASPSMARPAYDRRSEEPTSALQSLMRISYDVFCLNKTNNHIEHMNWKHAHAIRLNLPTTTQT